MKIQILTPRVFLPLLDKARFKGARGGRGSGKSHNFADMLVERMVAEADLKWVCIREVQKSLRFSAKALVEAKIIAHGVAHLFDIQRDLIKRRDGQGVVIFNGMQDHTADSIKSLEGFDGACIEEAQSISQRSWDLLEPTIRKEDSEIWASWNPDLPTDPIDKFFNDNKDDPNIILVTANIYDNPFASDTLWESYRRAKETALKHAAQGDESALARFEWIWHGGYNNNNAAIILAGHYTVKAFEPLIDWYKSYGVDWGFATDPTVMVESYFDEDNQDLYIFDEAYGEQVETVDLPKLFDNLDGARQYVSYADSARPENISHCRKNDYPLMKSVDKWQGSVEDGVSWLRGLNNIFIHPRCKHTIDEAGKWRYKTDEYTRDVLPDLVDKDNHCWDAIRYGNNKLIRGKTSSVFDNVE